MSTITEALFVWPLGEDAALIPRTAAIADAHFVLVEANYQRLGRWFPDAYQEAPTREGIRANFPDERRDLVLYSMLAGEWLSASARAARLPVQG